MNRLRMSFSSSPIFHQDTRSMLMLLGAITGIGLGVTGYCRHYRR